MVTGSDDGPVFGFILIGGALVGAQVRDVRLANELADRGYRVHAWWALERPKQSPLRPEISERWLCHGLRYFPDHFRGVTEVMGRISRWPVPDAARARLIQTMPGLLDAAMRGLVRFVCGGVEKDRSLICRFAREITAAGATHLLPNLSILCPFAAAARRHVPYPLRYLVTFQGYELYANYAREIGCEQAMYRRLYETVEQSDWPAIAVSPEYAERISADIGIPETWLRSIPPGVPIPERMEMTHAVATVQRHFPEYRPELPLVSYLGRRDSEKGIDLLLYAASILRRRGIGLQVAVCGPTAFGAGYGAVCRQIAENLRCPVLWSDYVSSETRSALFSASRTVVYPSIHAEPFGMVPVEAMAHGVPCIVPDTGGVSGLPRLGSDVGGLVFHSWDSGHLAEQMERLIQDQVLWAQLSAAAPRIAAHYSVAKLADRVLDHLGLPRHAGERLAEEEPEPLVRQAM